MPARGRAPVWILGVVCLLPLLAGCLGADDGTPAPPVPPVDAPPTGTLSEGALLRDGATLWSLRPWWEDLGAVHAEPDTQRLVQLALQRDEAGVLRLLSDGSAFWLVIDVDDAPVGGHVFARVIDADNNLTMARGQGVYEAAADGRYVALGLDAFDPVRFGAGYTVEVIWFTTPEQQDLMGAAAPDGPINGTVFRSWRAPVSFVPTYAVTFDGPTEGVDRPSTFEHAAFGGPPLGSYTATVSGERLWLVNLLLEFGPSLVAGTTPAAGGNGTTNVQLQLDGFQPLDHWRLVPRESGLEQSFALEVLIDYETLEDVPDVPNESDQYFFLTAAFGQRLAGETYTAGTLGRDLVVHVTAQLVP